MLLTCTELLKWTDLKLRVLSFLAANHLSNSCKVHDYNYIQMTNMFWNFPVLAVDDVVPMIIGCPNSDTYPVSCGIPARSVTWIPPTATDNSGGIPAVSSSHQPGASFPVGTTPVVYTFTDSAGNSAQCAFTVTGNSFLR